VLARGPWAPDHVEASWREDSYHSTAAMKRLADAALEQLRRRGSPAHDGMAARLAAFDADHNRLRLELQPARWALRLLDEASESLIAVCVVRSAAGCWLAGRRAAWVSTWPRRWTLGAAGAVEVGETPVETLIRELQEEWQLKPDSLTVEALLRLPNNASMLVGLATVPDDCRPAPDAEHDDWVWWSPDLGSWPCDADDRLKLIARLVG
jgi:8-oxo-dGTP diphosphatase